MVELILVLFLVVISLATFYLNKKWKYWEQKGVYQTKPIFPLVNSGLIITFGEHFNIVLERHTQETKGLPFYGSYFYQAPILFINDPDLVKKILVKDFDKFADHGLWIANKLKKSNTLSDKIWIKNLFFAEGEQWKNIRSTFSPIFTTKKLKVRVLT